MSKGILIVDDNASIRGLLRNYVETKTAFKVCGEAENGPEAIKKAALYRTSAQNNPVHHSRGGRQQ